MPPLQMSTTMSSGEAVNSAIVANQLYELPTAEHDTEIQYLNEIGPTSSPDLTFDGSNFKVHGNLRVSEGVSIGYLGQEGETYRGFEILTNDPNHIFLDAQVQSEEGINSYRMAFSKGNASTNGSSSLECDGLRTTFFMPIRVQPPVAPPVPSSFIDFGSQQAVPGFNQFNPVTFHFVFHSSPRVFVTLFDTTDSAPDDQSPVCPYIRDLTPSGCRLQLYGGEPGRPVTTNTTIQWMALGGQ